MQNIFHLKKSYSKISVIIVLAIVYFVGAKLGFMLIIPTTNVSPVWLASGIAFSSVMLFGYWVWPGIMLGGFVANLLLFSNITESIFEFVEAAALSEMIIVGYPHSVEDPEGRFILTFQKTYIGSKILLNSELGNIQNKNYILNTQTRPGQSGSPVFDRNFNVIGMLIGSFKLEVGAIVGGINPSSLNQTSYVISSEYIKEML